MATFTQRDGKWRAQVRKRGVSDSATFETKTQARAWATRREHEIDLGNTRTAVSHTLADAIDKYQREVSAGRQGERWESMRFAALARDFPLLVAKRLADVTTVDLADWRDRRLKTVKPGTVAREMNMLSPVLTIARDEWKWISESPLTGVRRPTEPRGRDQRIPEAVQAKLLHTMGYAPGKPLETATSRVGAAFVFAIETGMRSGEICALSWPHVHLDKHYVHVPDSKNGDARNVALSPRARGIIEQLTGADPVKVFGLSDKMRDALYRKARGNLTDLHFHDTRHEAITRLARKLDVLELARMVGVRDLKTLMVYFNSTATEIAEKLSK